ncbi:MAG: methylated-DNA--[protein]-cysteine S-methyltransferase [Rhodoferax sp.]|nr:methylated-DNA--[protein]-cysteine S-methyltransferase [Rhodoferax sp.]
MTFPASTVCQHLASPLGPIILAADATGLVGLWFDGQRHQPDTRHWPEATGHPLLDRAAAQLTDYLAGRRERFELPLSLAGGSPFQQSVWRALLRIPYGQTRSYGELAADLGQARAARAVGAAVGRNPLGIIVPCHRVVGTRGALTGYAGGLDRKIALLQLEGRPIPASSTPRSGIPDPKASPP